MAATPVSTVTDGIAGVEGDMLLIGGVGVGIAATLLVVRKGWRFLTGLIR